MTKKKYRVPEEDHLKRVQEALQRNPDLRKTYIILQMGIPRELVDKWMKSGLVTIKVCSAREKRDLFSK